MFETSGITPGELFSMTVPQFNAVAAHYERIDRERRVLPAALDELRGGNSVREWRLK